MIPRTIGHRPDTEWLEKRRPPMTVKTKLVELKEQLSNELAQINDSANIMKEVRENLIHLLTLSVNKANSTGSIDEKLSSLKQGQQDALDFVVEYENKNNDKVIRIKSKLQVIDDLLEVQQKYEEADKSQE